MSKHTIRQFQRLFFLIFWVFIKPVLCITDDLNQVQNQQFETEKKEKKKNLHINCTPIFISKNILIFF